MEQLRIEGSSDIPEILLDYASGRLEFSGRSLPEDVQEVYNPVLEWVSRYAEQPQKQTHVIFKFDYFNTASSKKILDLLDSVKTVQDNGNELKIDWYFMDNDEDMEEAGQSFSDFIEVPFNLISY
ncbi:DUF1987 domain-containing protein [Bacteroidota bacterium]